MLDIHTNLHACCRQIHTLCGILTAQDNLTVQVASAAVLTSSESGVRQLGGLLSYLSQDSDLNHINAKFCSTLISRGRLPSLFHVSAPIMMMPAVAMHACIFTRKGGFN